jgi:hypothetical protein
MKYNIEISKILDNHLPANGVGTKRELLRINIHKDMTDLINKLTIPVVSDMLCGSFDADNSTSSATKCKCGREKWEHPKPRD